MIESLISSSSAAISVLSVCIVGDAAVQVRRVDSRPLSLRFLRFSLKRFLAKGDFLMDLTMLTILV